MKVSIQLRPSVARKKENAAAVYFRIFDGKEKDFKAAGKITINPDFWDSTVPGYSRDTPEEVISAEERKTVNKLLKDIMEMTERTYTEKSDAKWLASVIGVCRQQSGFSDKLPAKSKPAPRTKKSTGKSAVTVVIPRIGGEDGAVTMVKPADKPGAAVTAKRKTALETGDNWMYATDYFRLYLEQSNFNGWHLVALTSVMHRLERYEKWLGHLNENENYRLSLADFDKEQVEDFADYMAREHEYRDENPDFFAQFNMKNPKWIRAVSKNSVTSGVKRLCMFLNWAVQQGYLTDTSFRQITCDQQIFGSPYYLTLEERDRIYALDLSDDPRLDYHRVKFIFQCHVGCRNNDLELFTWEHINGDFLEYIPHKNILAGRTQLVRVPLSDTAKEILCGLDPDKHFLFRDYHIEFYRQDIKKLVFAAGIERKVMVMNPLTRKAEARPLYEVAASHLARRTFIGNLYKRVKDPALIASLTGHTETSMSFNRYRTIDDDIKRDVLKYIE